MLLCTVTETIVGIDNAGEGKQDQILFRVDFFDRPDLSSPFFLKQTKRFMCDTLEECKALARDVFPGEELKFIGN